MTRSSTTPVGSSHASSEPVFESIPITSPRSLRQLSIFAIGAVCFLASTTLTRRAIYKRQLRIPPKFFDPNTNPHEHFSPLHDAITAVNLATMNCVSVGIMLVGGTLWALDISGFREVQLATRARVGLNERFYQEQANSTEESLEETIARKRAEEGNDDRPSAS